MAREFGYTNMRDVCFLHCRYIETWSVGIYARPSSIFPMAVLGPATASQEGNTHVHRRGPSC